MPWGVGADGGKTTTTTLAAMQGWFIVSPPTRTATVCEVQGSVQEACNSRAHKVHIIS